MYFFLFTLSIPEFGENPPDNIFSYPAKNKRCSKEELTPSVADVTH